MLETITIGSRDSQLALVQTYWVKEELERAYPELKVEIKKVKTVGDKILDTALSKIGDKGLFVKELENELLAGTIDLAVHSMKDLPTSLPAGLEIAATSLREDVRDVLCFSEPAIARGAKSIEDLKVVGTSSLRRVAQLKAQYPHLQFIDIRGNLNTRFRKLDDPKEGLDAIVLAAAGVKRLSKGIQSLAKYEDLNLLPAELDIIKGLAGRINIFLNPRECLPAIAQGALAIEISSARDEVRELLKVINSGIDDLIIRGERAFLRKLEGGCQVPIGIYSELDGHHIKYTGIVASVDGSKILRASISSTLDNSEFVAEQLANDLIDRGARDLIRS